MNLLSSSFLRRHAARAAGPLIAIVALRALAAHAATTPALIDDFSDSQHNRVGSERLVFDDKSVGSQSHATVKCEHGILAVEGELAPGRGVPAFITLPLVLSSDMKPQDASDYTGVRLRVKIIKGILSVQVASSEIQNFDYHTGGPVAGKHDEFQEVRIPFKDMKRGWSEQTPLNPKTVTSVNLVSFGMAKDAFSYEVDEIAFY